MKTYKLNPVYLVIALLLTSTSLFAQQDQEEIFDEISENVQAINTRYERINTSKNVNYKQYAGGLDSLYNNIQQQYALLQKKQNPKEKELVKANKQALDKIYENASKHLDGIKAEANKPKPNEMKIKQLSKLFVSQLQEAQVQNTDARKKLGKK
ncbi:MAG: hypothetical protein ACK4ND_00145 [Cytophagaceae bacterium]